MVRYSSSFVHKTKIRMQANDESSWDPIVKYIKDQHSAYLRKELTAQRERYIQDTRIHCCLFFIQPSGHA
jgi:septin family protein